MKSKIQRYISIKIFFVLVLAATCYLGSSCQCTPPGKPEGRLLVIMSRYARDSGYELIDLHGRRSDISKIFGVAGLAHKPAVWSPSGERLAYGGSTAEDNGYRSWIFDVDIATMTAQKYPLPDDGHDYDLTWSADGMSFLFVWARDDPGPLEIWRLDRATGQTSVLSQLPVGVGIESWSPDRSLVAIIIGQTYVKEPNSLVWKSGDLYIQNVDGTSRRMIHKSVFGDVVWSPDGKSIAFENAVELPGPEHICWMPVENGETICLQERGGSLTWSPNGECIAFTNSLGIRVVDTQTGIVQTLVDLVNDEKGAFYLDWSPDGKYLAYQKCHHPEANQSCDVYVVSSDGKESRRLTRNGFADEFPVWQPVIPTTD